MSGPSGGGGGPPAGGRDWTKPLLIGGGIALAAGATAAGVWYVRRRRRRRRERDRRLGLGDAESIGGDRVAQEDALEEELDGLRGPSPVPGQGQGQAGTGGRRILPLVPSRRSQQAGAGGAPSGRNAAVGRQRQQQQPQAEQPQPPQHQQERKRPAGMTVSTAGAGLARPLEPLPLTPVDPAEQARAQRALLRSAHARQLAQARFEPVRIASTPMASPARPSSRRPSMDQRLQQHSRQPSLQQVPEQTRLVAPPPLTASPQQQQGRRQLVPSRLHRMGSTITRFVTTSADTTSMQLGRQLARLPERSRPLALLLFLACLVLVMLLAAVDSRTVYVAVLLGFFLHSLGVLSYEPVSLPPLVDGECREDGFGETGDGRYLDAPAAGEGEGAGTPRPVVSLLGSEADDVASASLAAAADAAAAQGPQGWFEEKGPEVPGYYDDVEEDEAERVRLTSAVAQARILSAAEAQADAEAALEEREHQDALVLAVARDREFFAPTWLDLASFDQSLQTFELTLTIKAPWHVVVEEYWDKNLPFDASLYAPGASASRSRVNGFLQLTPPEIPSGQYHLEADEAKEPTGQPSMTDDLSYVLRKRFRCPASDALYTVRDMCVYNKLPKMVRGYLGPAADESHLYICEYSRIDLGGTECPFAPPPNGGAVPHTPGVLTANFDEDIAGPRFILRAVNRDYRNLCLSDDERCFRPHPVNPNITIFRQVSRLAIGDSFSWVRSVVRNLGAGTLKKRAERDIQAFTEKLELVLKARANQG